MAFKFLDAVTSTGTSLSMPVRKIIKDHTVQATITGAPTAVTVDLEGSLNDTEWFVLGTHPFTAGELTDTQAMFHVVDKSVRYVRLNLAVLTGGSSPTVTALYEGFEHRD